MTLIFKLLDYLVLQMNSCKFEQPASCLLYTKTNYAETSEEYLKILSWVQEKQIYNYGPNIEKLKNELAQWSAKFCLDFKTKCQPRTIQTTIQSLNHVKFFILTKQQLVWKNNELFNQVTRLFVAINHAVTERIHLAAMYGTQEVQSFTYNTKKNIIYLKSAAIPNT